MSDALSRRAFLLRSCAAGLVVPLVAVLGEATATAAPALPGVTVRPRADWAQGLSAAGALESEKPGDVRFLLVHHSDSTNGYAPGDVPAVLRGFHAFHTGPAKGWPDVAYNFFVDRYGGVWEGRTGSLAGPVQSDATGGSQGFAQICCFIGDHTTEPPTPEARRSMTLLLAALADRYGIEPRSTTTFVSRGSNRWPAGATVTTPTIAGHRDMSLTDCPGDAAYPLVTDHFPAAVAAVLAARATPTPAPTSAQPAPSPSPSSSPAAPPSPRPVTAATAGAGRDDGIEPGAAAVVGGVVVAAGAAVAAARRLRRRSAAAPPAGPPEGPAS